MENKKQYWLFKSEPNTFSFEDLKKRPKQTEPWDGVRNYQARNFMRDSMKTGDFILFYHSSCETPAIMGLAEVYSKAYPDPTAFDKNSKYFDEKSTVENPRWFLVDVKYKNTFKKPITLKEIKMHPELSQMLLIKKGQRLSIQPVSEKEFKFILGLAGL